MKKPWKFLNSETLFGYSVTLLILFLIIGPLLILIRNTFSIGAPGSSAGYTLDNWWRVLTSDAYRVALRHTLFLGLATPALAALIGIPFAWIVARTDTPLKRLWEQMAIIPMLVPAVIAGLAWMLLGAKNSGLLTISLTCLVWGLRPSTSTIPGALPLQWPYLSPYVILFVLGHLKSMDPALEEASRTCGASIWRTMRSITIPAVLPAILGSLLLIFVLAVDFVAIPVMLGWASKYFAMTSWIWQHIVFMPDYGVAAILSIVLVIISMGGMYLSERLLRGRSFAVITGKGFRPGIVALGRWKWVTSVYCVLYMMVTILLPVGVVILASVQTYTWNWGFSLKTHQLMLKYPSAILGLKNSFIVGVVGGLAVVVLGFCVSWLVLRSEYRFRKFLNYLSMMSLAIPRDFPCHGTSLDMG